MRKLLITLAGFCGIGLVAVGVLFFLYAGKLKTEIQGRFEGKRWDLPAVIYARPLELFPGQNMSAQMLENELLLSGYRQETQPQGEGSYNRKGNTIELISRGFYFPTGFEASQKVTIAFSGNSIASILATDTKASLTNIRLDPATIGSFHPLAHEDRIVLKYEEIPKLLVDTLLAIEDQHFFTHSGIAPLAILRALIVNIKAGETVQGGSTITQQLVKNLFLNHERTAARKIKEAVMAVILDWKYSKQEILTAYINEVFLGQDGNRAIHGFALASQYYFHRSLQDLNAGQVAMLVGMVKGPSYYDPQRNPDNCKERRQIILKKIADLQMIDQNQLQEAINQPLIDVKIQKGGFNRFPAFLDLVREQLSRDYQEEDLKSNGLQVLTTLDPHVQFQMENTLKDSIAKLEKQTNKEGIEGAMVVTNRDNGEILGMAGGKVPVQKSFNRALQAKRPIGSLVKPAIYLTALENGYNLASPQQDSYYSYTGADGKEWVPQNYDKEEHGRIALFAALANSYNLATVRLGMEVGLPKVLDTLKKLGYSGTTEAMPSMLLGAIEMTPFEVAQMYQTYAADGFFTPLRAIDTVLAADHSVLKRYGLSVEQRFAPETVFLLDHALQRVTSEGTAKALKNSSLRNCNPAGKTGTTNDMRDSWFAGFTGDRLAVVWLGHDDNTPISLTGASGALYVWTRTLSEIQTEPLTLTEPEGIVWKNIDRYTLQPGEGEGGYTTSLPFLASNNGAGASDVSGKTEEGQKNKGKGGLLETIKGWMN